MSYLRMPSRVKLSGLYLGFCRCRKACYQEGSLNESQGMLMSVVLKLTDVGGGGVLLCEDACTQSAGF